MSTKNSSDTIENRARDLPTCSTVPQPTAPPRALLYIVDVHEFSKNPETIAEIKALEWGHEARSILKTRRYWGKKFSGYSDLAIGIWRPVTYFKEIFVQLALQYTYNFDANLLWYQETSQVTNLCWWTAGTSCK